MTDKEQIICKYKFQDKEKFDGKPYCLCFNELCEDLSFACDDNCQIYEDYKQLARKTKELEKLREANDEKNKFLQDLGISAGGEFKRIKFYIEGLKNKYNEKVKECEELKIRLYEYEKYGGIIDEGRKWAALANDYSKALESIEEIIKNDFRDDYKVSGVLTLIDSYLTENGKFVDERGDFLKAFEDLLDKEHSSGNKTFSISRQILDIINKTKE